MQRIEPATHIARGSGIYVLDEPTTGGRLADGQLLGPLDRLVDSVAEAFKSHQAETEGHVSNIEKAFEALGEKAKAEKCAGIDGIKQEHDDFVNDESPSPEILDSFLTGAGARAEHYEIAAYEGLIAAAEALGEEKVAKLLTENLAQEKEALQKLKTIGKRLARESAKDAATA